MHTVLTQAIDGYDIIVGFDRAVLDPEGTKKKVKKAEENTEEKKAICSKLAEVKEYLLDRDAIMKGKKKVDKKGKKIEELTEKIATINTELPPLIQAMSEKTKQLADELAVYFNTRQGEYTLSDTEYERLHGLWTEAQKSKVPDKYLIAYPSGDSVADNRMVGSMHNAELKRVSKIGQEPEGVILNGKTQEEIETIRISQLTDDQKRAEYAARLPALSEAAVRYRSRLEIEEAPDPLEGAKVYLQEEKAKLAGIYGLPV